MEKRTHLQNTQDGNTWPNDSLGPCIFVREDFLSPDFFQNYGSRVRHIPSVISGHVSHLCSVRGGASLTPGRTLRPTHKAYKSSVSSCQPHSLTRNCRRKSTNSFFTHVFLRVILPSLWIPLQLKKPSRTFINSLMRTGHACAS